MAEADDEVRQQLSAHGDNGSTPRHTLFYFYDGDIDLLDDLALSNGFATRRTIESHGLILEKTTSVDETSFAPIAAMIEEWALRCGADYDGWECELLPSH